ncbi:MAG: T9SS type A sorting domain-containing protein [Bacteroidia bacterium]
MVSVEKKHYPDSHSTQPRSTVGFIVNPDNDDAHLRVELSPFAEDESIIRVMDETGNVLLQEQKEPEHTGRLEYTVSNLNSGTYFFEVSDGFYYQVKEVRV